MNDLFYTKDFVAASFSRVEENEDVAAFYEWLGAEMADEVLERKAKHVRLCLKFWDVDWYRMQSVKDVKRVNACKDLFCFNCQHNLAIQRYEKYKPVLDDLESVFDLYHVTFTVPDPEGPDLRRVLNKMYKKFVYIVQYFSGVRKSRFMDFSQFGYVGCVRSLEVTFKKKNGVLYYHPHFHCVFVLKKGMNFRKAIYNCFSHSYKNDRLRSFSKFEIMVQNFWYLVYNDIPFTQENFEAVTRGYSCTAEKCDDHAVHEVFKYAVGGMFKKKNKPLLCRDVLEVLYTSFYRRKIIQGYGILNKFQFDITSDDETIKEYFAYKQQLLKLEKPVAQALHASEVRKDMSENMTYISRWKKNFKDEEE